MQSKKKYIGLVDDHDLFREGLRYIIERNENYSVQFEANNGKEFLDKISVSVPDLVLMDIEMPVMNGAEATKRALKKYPDLKIIVLSMFGDQQYYRQMIALGVKGFLLKDSGKTELERAIVDVIDGGNYFSQQLLKNIIAGIPNEKNSAVNILNTFSKREVEVLHCVCQGLSNHEISDKLFISPKTVEGHKSKLMQKTETHNAVSLVMFAIKNKLISIP